MYVYRPDAVPIKFVWLHLGNFRSWYVFVLSCTMICLAIFIITIPTKATDRYNLPFELKRFLFWNRSFHENEINKTCSCFSFNVTKCTRIWWCYTVGSTMLMFARNVKVLWTWTMEWTTLLFRVFIRSPRSVQLCQTLLISNQSMKSTSS